jgi:F0F1-type ATP synthase membrane subunit a
MDIRLTAAIMVTVGFALIVLVFYILLTGKKKKSIKNQKKPKKTKKKQHDRSMKALLKILKDKTTSAEELSSVLDLIIKFHGDIPKQHVGKKGTSFDPYIDILFTICRHPNTNKKIITNFDSALSKKNPSFAFGINDAVSKGLDSRG